VGLFSDDLLDDGLVLPADSMAPSAMF